ncbi:hypothetical protein V1478_014321 [Vespula squamosa]|uniref:Uncharacterized protein n=1 Tax=Vespula squamosa TaxID=30214 RepID=A0ABD2AAB0_VESSQ
MHSVRRRNSCSIESKATIKSNVSSGRATGDGDLCLPRCWPGLAVIGRYELEKERYRIKKRKREKEKKREGGCGHLKCRLASGETSANADVNVRALAVPSVLLRLASVLRCPSLLPSPPLLPSPSPPTSPSPTSFTSYFYRKSFQLLRTSLLLRSKASLQATPSIRKLGGKFVQSIAAVGTRYSRATYKVRRSKPETVTRLKPSRFRGKPRSAEISTPSFIQTSNGSCIKRDPALEVSIMETFLITLRHVTRPRNLRYASQKLLRNDPDSSRRRRWTDIDWISRMEPYPTEPSEQNNSRRAGAQTDLEYSRSLISIRARRRTPTSLGILMNGDTVLAAKEDDVDP